jgi:hypothetical protein
MCARNNFLVLIIVESIDCLKSRKGQEYVRIVVHAEIFEGSLANLGNEMIHVVDCMPETSDLLYALQVSKLLLHSTWPLLNDEEQFLALHANHGSVVQITLGLHTVFHAQLALEFFARPISFMGGYFHSKGITAISDITALCQSSSRRWSKTVIVTLWAS